MAKLKPFKAIRPARDKAHLVATRPVYTYRKPILKAKLEENPYTFIRIINPEFNEIVKTKANSRERFLNVKHQFEQFCQAGILMQDKEEHLYLYRQTKGGHAFVGVIAGASVDEYERDLVKKHEATLTSREEMFTNYLDIVGFNAEPVLLSYPKNDALNALYEKIMQDRPEYEFSTTDQVKHELWLVNKSDETALLGLFDAIPVTYIADGHHRSASSARLAEKYEALGNVKTQNHKYFLAFLMDESRMNILEFNRLVKSLKGMDSKVLLEKLGQNFELEKLNSAQKPAKEHEITMNLRGNWYKLTCKPQIVDENHPVACLDAEILTRYILTPLLGIRDLKTDSNIEFVSGNLGISAISDAIENQKAELGFILYPITMEQVKRVADNHLIMPPKSTWVEPKTTQRPDHIQHQGMIAERILQLKAELPESVKLVAVSKTKPVEDILQAYQAGQRVFGENKVQEMCEKYEALPKDIEWHLIGHLQTNKVKYIAPFVSLVHAVDSLKLLAEINKEAKKNKRVIDCLLQFHIAQEDTKFGLDFDEATEILKSESYHEMENVRIVGLMGMASFTDNTEQIEDEFRTLYNYFQIIKSHYFKFNPDFREISMGMSGDYQIAVAEGSTMVRVGSSIFGGR